MMYVIQQPLQKHAIKRAFRCTGSSPLADNRKRRSTVCSCVPLCKNSSTVPNVSNVELPFRVDMQNDSRRSAAHAAVHTAWAVQFSLLFEFFMHLQSEKYSQTDFTMTQPQPRTALAPLCKTMPAAGQCRTRQSLQPKYDT